VGTAIATLVRKPQHEGAQTVQFRHLWGTGKRAQLKDEAADPNTAVYEEIAPSPEIGLPFMPHTVGVDYFAWPLLPDLFPVSFPGVETSRDSGLVEIDKHLLLERMQHYFDPKVTDNDLQKEAKVLVTDAARFN